MKRALITGVTGQDGSYLSELLRGKGYHIHGVDCRQPNSGDWNCPPDQPGFSFSIGDIIDPNFIQKSIQDFQPDEIYNLASQSRPDVSGQIADQTYAANLTAVVQILAAILQSHRPIRFFQASSSEIFGNAARSPQNETTPIAPRNPYGISKAAAHWHTRYCRENQGAFVCNGILYNHESPRRSENFVTRKITLAAARIKLGQQSQLTLGNLDAQRDWGYAPDYAEAMWLMLQSDEPDDYVIATGQLHTVGDVLRIAFDTVGLDWREFAKIDDQYKREENGAPLLGDSSKARQELNWQPRISFEQMIRLMVESDLRYAREHPLAKDH